jgi:hypothetical protein
VTTFSDWLALREPADAAARSRDLVDVLRPLLPEPVTVHDLGCGTGSMGRWLAPLLPVEQRWVLHDRDPDLLAVAASQPPAGVPVETRTHDVTALPPGALDGAGLVTSSAIVDVLTEHELAGFADGCAAARVPVLVTLEVTGVVELQPADSLDAELRDAFNDHQRRSVRGGRLLGPDSPTTTAEAFRARGYDVHTAPSPWRLDAAMTDLLRAWMEGWVGAAVEQRPELAEPAGVWTKTRAAQLDAGALAVTVHHEDLLAVPR